MRPETKMDPPMQEILGETSGVRPENVADAEALPEGAEGIDRFGKRPPIVGDEGGIDGAGGNARQDGDTEVGKMIGKAAQETHLIGRVRAPSA